MTTINRRPKVDGFDNGDGIYYYRRDGQRILIEVDPHILLDIHAIPTYKNTIINLLLTYNERKFIDYVILTEKRGFRDSLHDNNPIVHICNRLHIPVLYFNCESQDDAYKTFLHAVANGSPTCAVYFYHDGDFGNRNFLSESKLPYEVVRL